MWDDMTSHVCRHAERDGSHATNVALLCIVLFCQSLVKLPVFSGAISVIRRKESVPSLDYIVQ